MDADTTQANMKEKRPPLHRRMYDWVLHWANTPYGLTALAIIAFVESSFFPIPPDILLMALVLASPKRWWLVALVCTISSVLGGLGGYAIGMFAWESLGKLIVEGMLKIPLVSIDGRMDILMPSYLTSNFGDYLGGSYLFQVYDKWNAWIVGVFGLTPLPYKLVTITAGVAQVNLSVFIVASIISRGLRFFAVSLILRLVGEPAKKFIDKNFNLLTILFVAVLIGGFLALKLLF